MTTILETKRLILKPLALSQLDDLIALRSDPDVMKYLGVGRPQNKMEVINFIESAVPYYEKHGLGFFSVYEKENLNFVGQAGLFHLGFNEDQSDIEVAYRLHKKYWSRGYATELAKALIKWGFNKLKIKKITAVIYPENIASRRVLEKSGMHYLKRGLYNNINVCYYEIQKKYIDLNNIKLVPATQDDLPIMENLGRFYGYDISEYYGHEPGWEMDDDGLYGCGINFKNYFEKENCFPFLIRYQNELAGFAIVDKKGSDPSIDFNIAQFFILRTYKGQGIGQHCAYECFNKFKGTWEVMVMPGNESAYRFWRFIISNYSKNNFEEYTRPLTNGERNLFKFSSGK